MKQFWLALVTALLLACAPPTPATVPVSEAPAWDIACEMARGTVLSCKNVAQPIVFYFNADPITKKDELGQYGYYYGGKIVYVSNQLTGKHKKAVEFHEIIHYLQWINQTLALPARTKQACDAENQAYALTDIYIEVILEDPDNMKGETWWQNYAQCQPWYAPEGYIKSKGM